MKNHSPSDPGPPPTISDFDKPFRRNVISKATLSVGLITLIALIAREVISPVELASLLKQLLLSLMLLCIPLLIRRNVSSEICGMLFVLILTLMGVNSGFLNGGMGAPAVILFVFSPMIGFFCIGPRGAKVAFLLSALAMAILLYAEHVSATQPLQDPAKYTRYKTVIYLFATAASYAVGAIYEKSRKISEQLLTEISMKAIQSSKMVSLGEMASGIAHEINNPLTIISGKLSKLVRQIDAGDVDGAKIKEQILQINTTALRIAKIIKGLKSFSRNTEKEFWEPESLAVIIDESLTLCMERIHHLSIDLQVTCDATLIIECSSVQISQIILNLLGNSCDAIEKLPEKWIKIEAVEHEKKVQLSITDSGNGIPAAVVEKMMHPFFTTKEIGKGTGLGLSISFGIAKLHQGELRYDATSPNTRFVLELPIKTVENGV